MSEFNVSSAEAVKLENEYSAHNYHPLPVIIAKGQGAKVWDPEGHEYLDFLSAYSAVNQGHCHPKIVQALIDQAQRLTLCSRAFYSDIFGPYSKFVCDYFGYEMLLPMNTGAEAVETALKLARKWGYKHKGIPENDAIVLAASDNFHGRTLAIVSMSSDPEARGHFGPYIEGATSLIPGTNEPLRYNNVGDIEKALNKCGDKVAAIILEPIQGEAGIIVPDEDYFSKVSALCKKHNVLLIADEIQTGIARTGKMLCVEHYGVKPDVVLLGKALSGGVTPVSAVLSSRDVLLTFETGTHGSTYGGNPLGCAAAIAALQVVKDENLVDRAEKLGQRFRDGLAPLLKTGAISAVRGKGLLNAIQVDYSKTNGRSAWDLCLLMKNHGVLAKPTHDTIIRLAPPLVISEQDLDKSIEVIKTCVEQLPQAPKAEH